MKTIVYILSGLSFFLIIVACILLSKPKEVVNDQKYINEMKAEIVALKTEIKDIKRNLIKQYENIDTVTTSSGAIDSNEDFIRRVNGNLPPGHPDR